MDDYEKRKLGIFNQLNFFQLLTGIIIPIAGLIGNHHLPALAWAVACMPALVSVLVLVLNARQEYATLPNWPILASTLLLPALFISGDLAWE